MYPLPPSLPSDSLPTSATLPPSPAGEGNTPESNTPIGFAVEESGFSRNLSRTRHPSTSFNSRLQLADTEPARVPHAVAFRLVRPSEPSLNSMGALQKTMTVLLVALLLGWGYLTLRRSISTVREAWHSTDTRAAQSMSQPKRYLFENAEIPGPYQSGSSLWQALREHLGSPTQPPPIRRPVL